jgi:hypothetical protein
MVQMRGESIGVATRSASEVEKMFRNELLVGDGGRRGETVGQEAEGFFD